MLLYSISLQVDLRSVELFINVQDNNDSEDEEDDLFRPRQVAEAERPLQKSNALDTIDTSVLTEDLKALTVWESEDAREQLRNRFVTGMIKVTKSAT